MEPIQQSNDSLLFANKAQDRQGAEPVGLIGHRGSSERYPENTMAAFEAARMEGADGVEVDVRRAKDGRFVAMHDASVDRTTDGNGLVSSLGWEEIQRLDAGGWKSPCFRGEPVPLLEQVLDAYQSLDLVLLLQCKDMAMADVGRVAAMIDARNMLPQCFLFAPPNIIGPMKAMKPELMVINDGTGHMLRPLVDRAIHENWNAVSTGFDQMEPDEVARARGHGLHVQCSFLTEGQYQERIPRLLAWGVNLLLGDNCAAMEAVVRSRRNSRS